MFKLHEFAVDISITVFVGVERSFKTHFQSRELFLTASIGVKTSFVNIKALWLSEILLKLRLEIATANIHINAIATINSIKVKPFLYFFIKKLVKIVKMC